MKIVRKIALRGRIQHLREICFRMPWSASQTEHCRPFSWLRGKCKSERKSANESEIVQHNLVRTGQKEQNRANAWFEEVLGWRCRGKFVVCSLHCFPNISKDFQRFPKFSKVFQKFPNIPKVFQSLPKVPKLLKKSRAEVDIFSGQWLLPERCARVNFPPSASHCKN